MNTKTHLLDLVAKDQLKLFFKQINNVPSLSSKEKRQLVELSGRYHNLENKYRENVIHLSDYQIESAKIRKSLISILSTQYAPQINVLSSKRKKIITWAVLGVTLLSGCYFFYKTVSTNVTSELEGYHSSISTTTDKIIQKDDSARVAVTPNTDQSKSEIKRQPHGGVSSPVETQQQPQTTNKSVSALPPNKETIRAETIQQTKENREILLQLSTNLGNSNVVVKSNQELRLFTEVNKPCFIRIIYQLVTGEMVLLHDNQEIKQQDINRKIEIGDGFVPDEPFGKEHLYALASTTPFDPLSIREEDGYTFITSSLDEAITISKGLKKSQRTTVNHLEILTLK